MSKDTDSVSVMFTILFCRFVVSGSVHVEVRKRGDRKKGEIASYHNVCFLASLLGCILMNHEQRYLRVLTI